MERFLCLNMKILSLEVVEPCSGGHYINNIHLDSDHVFCLIPTFLSDK